MAGTVLLMVHIAAGSVALATAIIALITAKGGTHHIRAGRVYAVAMTVIFITALPLAILGSNVFLSLIALFSFYLVFAGWRFARNRHGRAQPVDWAAVAVMGLTGLGMWGYGAVLLLSGSAQWITMAVFGSIAVALSGADARFHTGRRAFGKQRIARHLTNMLAGTIATITAVLVVNVETDPVWLAWILPTIVITPLIVWWNVQIGRETKRRETPG